MFETFGVWISIWFFYWLEDGELERHLSGRLKWKRERERERVSWCIKPSQPQRIKSGLKETFIKRYVVERTNKAGIRPGKQSEKAESCRKNLWNEIQLKGP